MLKIRDLSSFLRAQDDIVEGKGGHYAAKRRQLGAEYNSIPDTYSDTLDKNPRTATSVASARSIRRVWSKRQPRWLKSYRVYDVTGDRYAGEWPREQVPPGGWWTRQNAPGSSML